MVRRAASNMRKDLYQSFRNYYAAWPLQRAAVCIVTNHRLQPLQGKCRKSTPGMCHYTFVSTCILFSVSVSCSCPSRHKSTDSSRHQQLRSEKGNMQVVQRTKKRTLSSCICCGGHTCKEHQVICCKSCWKDWTHTHPPTHTHTHRHTLNT